MRMYNTRLTSCSCRRREIIIHHDGNIFFSEKYKNIANTRRMCVQCDRRRGFCLIDYVVVKCFWPFEKNKKTNSNRQGVFLKV
jgi:hypothetical protein